MLDLAAEACRNAAADAGLALREIDGVGSFSVFNDSVPCSAVATALALPTLRYTLDLNAAGQSPCHAIQMAASAIRSGYAEAIVIFRALNGRSGVRIGHGAIPGGAGAYRYPIGYSSYLMYIAMWARRYMIETGATAAELARSPWRNAGTHNETAVPSFASRSISRLIIVRRWSATRSALPIALRKLTAPAPSGDKPRTRPRSQTAAGGDWVDRLPRRCTPRPRCRRPVPVRRLFAQFHQPPARRTLRARRRQRRRCVFRRDLRLLHQYRAVRAGRARLVQARRGRRFHPLGRHRDRRPAANQYQRRPCSPRAICTA